MQYHKLEDWKDQWKHACAIIYLLICVTDFIVAPAVNQLANRNSRQEMIALIDKLQDSDAKVAAINKLSFSSQWEPLTLQGGGLFHLSFGAILGIVAFKNSKKEEEKEE